jgi:glucose/mannose-6-phosphate isomerase
MNLDDLKTVSALDSDCVAESIRFLPVQIKDAASLDKNFKLPADYKKISRVVINGMGGSNLGARIIASVFKEEASVPILIEPGYGVPGYVDSKTLYIISSYSGNTEEPLSVYAEAKRRGAKIVLITAAGAKNKLANLMKKENLPGIVFSPQNNPSGQPRLGLGYTLFLTLLILQKAGVFKLGAEEPERIAAVLEENNSGLCLAAPRAKNKAKKIAEQIFNKEIVLIGGDFLEGSLHALRNQLCENSKNFSQYLVLPEMNHYALESLANPSGNQNNLVFLFLESGLYSPRVQKRFKLTREIVIKNKIKAVVHRLAGKTKLSQAAELLQFGSWLTFYLAILNEVDPSLIPWVDWFKKKLG